MRSRKIFIAAVMLFIGIIALLGCQQNKASVSGKVQSADGVEIEYEMCGSADTALVFVHGWSCDKSYWQDQLPFFCHFYKVVTIDLAGHGKSGTNRTDWTIQAFAQDVAAVVNSLDLRPVVLIGHSMGGPVILEATHLFPDRVVGLIGVDTFQDFSHRMTQNEINQYLAPLKADFKKGAYAFVKNRLFSPQSDSSIVNKIANDMSSAPPEIALAAIENAWKYDMRRGVLGLRVPIRCINSDIFPVNTEGNRRYVKSFNVLFMSDVGHFVMNEEPALFNTLLDASIRDFFISEESR